MTITINLVYIIAVWLYALVVTGFWVCALIGGSKEKQDAIMEAEEKRKATICFGEKTRELAERIEKMRGEVEILKGEKLTLAEQYIKIQNEYAWFRQMVRVSEPGEVEEALAKIKKQRERFPADETDSEDKKNGSLNNKGEVNNG